MKLPQKHAAVLLHLPAKHVPNVLAVITSYQTSQPPTPSKSPHEPGRVHSAASSLFFGPSVLPLPFVGFGSPRGGCAATVAVDGLKSVF